MTKKQLAATIAAVLTALAAVLTQCPEDSTAPSTPVDTADAGASLKLDMHDVTRTVVQIGAAQ